MQGNLQENNITLYFRELLISNQDSSYFGELPGILSQVILTLHCFQATVPYKILDISAAISVSTLTSWIQLFDSRLHVYLY